MSNKRIQKKYNKKILKINFKNDIEVESFKSRSKLSFRQTMILFDYFTYNILHCADDSVKARENLIKIINLRYFDMEDN